MQDGYQGYVAQLKDQNTLLLNLQAGIGFLFIYLLL